MIVVVPRGVVARRHFGAGAIGLALLGCGAGVVVIAIRAELGAIRTLLAERGEQP